MDLEKAVTRDRCASKVFRCLVTRKSAELADPEHPINHLDEIWKDVLSSRPTCRRKKRKRKAAADSVPDADPEKSTKLESGGVCEKTVSSSSVDQHHMELEVHATTEQTPELISSDDCQPPKRRIEPVPIEVIERYRLSVEQIREIPRFQNYSTGTPSPV